MIDLKKRIYSEDVQSTEEDTKVVLAGWARDVKNLGKVAFIKLRDIKGETQVTALPDFKKFNNLNDISKESVISVIGIVKNSQLKSGAKEVILEDYEILSKADVLPIDISGKIPTTFDKRIDNRFLDTRRPEISAIFKVRAELFKAIVDFFESNNFINIQTPKITAAGVESGAELFKIKYFDRDAYLAQSPQIYKQMFVCGGFERVYEIGPVFRAEKSHTTRHLTEFTGVDFEMGFINSFEDVMDTIENMFKYILFHVNKKCRKELEILKVKIEVPSKIPRVKMKEIKEILKKEYKKELPEEEDFDPEAEKMVGEIAKKKYGSDFIFVTHYPWSKRPFYHMKPNAKETCSFDLLWRGVEVATGAQREHRYDILKKQAEEKGIDLDAMKDYAALFKFGAPPHGGAGFGLDRMTQRLLNLENVKEALLLPRDPERLTP